MATYGNDILNNLEPGQPILPSFHLTCFGCAYSHDMYDDLQYGCLMTKCRKQNDKLIPAVHPTIDCKQFGYPPWDEEEHN